MKKLVLILFIGLISNAYTQDIQCGTKIFEGNPEGGGGGPGVPGGVV